MSNKKQIESDTIVDKKIDKHPILYVFSFIILVIIVVTFLGSPIAGKMSGGTRITFGKFGNKAIEFYPGNYLSEQKDILAQNLDKNSNADIQFQAYQVWRGAFERTVIHTAILWMAETSSINISNDKIDNTLVKYGPYSVNGEFSIEKYNNTSRAERNRYRTYYKDTLVKELYLRDFFKGIKISKNEYNFISGMGTDERAVDIAYIPFDSYPDTEAVSFAESNGILFQSAELSRITILSDKKDAEKIHSIISANPDSFSDTAKNQSKDNYSDNGGDMGLAYYYSTKMELKNASDADIVFSLAPGDISPVLETNSGWVIYKLKSPVKKINIEDAASVSIVKNYMSTYESGKIEDYFTQKAQFAKLPAADLKSDAVKNGFSIYKTSSFPINYGNSILFKQIQVENGPANLKMLNNNEDFLIKAFSLKEKEISEPVILSDSLILLSLDSETKNDEFSSLVNAYYPYVIQQINDQTLSAFLLKSDKLTDNFNTVFSKYFMAN